MNTLRREYLKLVGAIGAAIGTIGGAGWLVFGSDREGNSDNDSDSGSDSGSDNDGNSEQEQEEAAQEPESEPKSSEDEEEIEDDEEDKTTEEVVPDEEETTPDKEQYEQEEPEREELPEDSVSLEATMDVGEYGSVELTGTVTNETSETISLVNLEITYLDSEGTVIGGGGAMVEDLPSGETKEWGHSVAPDTLRGDPAEAEIIPRPYR